MQRRYSLSALDVAALAGAAGATFAYARTLGISRSGSALAAVSFTLCGFQAAHIVHEPFNQLMPYLPLCLLLGEKYLATGKIAWLAGLALAWGTQLTIGHFQIQMWTAGLVVLSGMWRVWATGKRWQHGLWVNALSAQVSCGGS